MSSFQKFKFLATQCTATASPTLSPTASPVVHLRRRKTLRRLLSGGRRRLPENDESIDRRRNSSEKRKELIGVRSKLRDLFISSPPSGETTECRGVLPGTDSDSSVSDWRRFGPRSIRPLSSLRLRQRLMRRSVWHPVLGTIPE